MKKKDNNLNKNGEIETFIEIFNHYEYKYFNLKLKSNGLAWWPLIRFKVADNLMIERDLKWPSIIIKKEKLLLIKTYIKYIKSILLDLFTILILYFKPIETIYIGSRNIPDFKNSIKSNKKDYLLIGNREIFTGNSLFISKSNLDIVKKLLTNFIKIPKELIDDSIKIRTELKTTLNTKINISKIIINEYKNQIAYLWIWRILIKYTKGTKKIIFINDCSQNTLMLIAKKIGIETIEVQHGYIGKAHEAYTFPDLDFKINSLPDKIIINSNFSVTKYPVKKVSSRFLLKSKNKKINTKEKYIDVLIGSSPKLLNETRLILDLLTKYNFKLALKLHPSENSNLYKNYYYKNKIKIFSGEKDIKEIAEKSKIYIPVFPLSTSAFEAYSSGSKILTINYNGRKLSNILDSVINISVNSIYDLPEIINKLIIEI